jgi:hypothetical protein
MPNSEATDIATVNFAPINIYTLESVEEALSGPVGHCVRY